MTDPLTLAEEIEHFGVLATDARSAGNLAAFTAELGAVTREHCSLIATALRLSELVLEGSLENRTLKQAQEWGRRRDDAFYHYCAARDSARGAK